MGNPEFSVAVGEQRHQGFELDVNGEILPGLKTSVNYAYLDAEITEGDAADRGNRRRHVPEQSASLWLRYELQTGPLKGLGVGSGVYLRDEVAVDNPNSAFIEGYERVDLALFYTGARNWDIRFNVRNLLDADYIESPANSRPSTVLARL